MNIFITDDIHVEQYDVDNFERYNFTREKLDPANYDGFCESVEKCSFEEWCDENLDYEEIYNIPMMNALRYFPSFVEFTGKEETAPNTCLIYDNDKEAWAVAMTGGGMDLSPWLLDTFVMLGKGIPTELARGIDYGWCKQRLGEKRWDEIRRGIAKALEDEADRFCTKAKELKQ